MTMVSEARTMARRLGSLLGRAGGVTHGVGEKDSGRAGFSLTSAAEARCTMVAGSPGRRVAGSPGRRVAGSPAMSASGAWRRCSSSPASPPEPSRCAGGGFAPAHRRNPSETPSRSSALRRVFAGHGAAAFACRAFLAVLVLSALWAGLSPAYAHTGHDALGNCNAVADVHDLIACKVHRHEAHTGNTGAAAKWNAAKRLVNGLGSDADRALVESLPKKHRTRILAAVPAAAPPVAEQEQEQDDPPRAAQQQDDDPPTFTLTVITKRETSITVATPHRFTGKAVQRREWYLDGVLVEDGHRNKVQRTFSNLTPGTTYTIKVRVGYGRFGPSRIEGWLESDVLTVTTAGTKPVVLLPDTPGKIEWKVITAESIKVRVTYPGRVKRDDYSGFSIRLFKAGTSRTDPSVQGNDLPIVRKQDADDFTFDGLTENTEYKIVVKARICKDGSTSECEGTVNQDVVDIEGKFRTLNASTPIRDPSIKVHRVTPTSIEVRAENLTGHPVRQTVQLNLWPASNGKAFIAGCPFAILANRNSGASDVTLLPKGDLDDDTYGDCSGMTSQVIAPGAVRFGGLKAGTKYLTQMRFTGDYDQKLLKFDIKTPRKNEIVDFPKPPLSATTESAYATGHFVTLAIDGPTVIKEPTTSGATTDSTFKITYSRQRGRSLPENVIFHLCTGGDATLGDDYEIYGSNGALVQFIESGGCRQITITPSVRYVETYTLKVKHDSIDDTDESIVLSLKRVSATEPGVVFSNPIHWLVTNSGPLPKEWLSRFGRTVAEQALDGIAGRVAAPRSPGAEGRLAGQRLHTGTASATPALPARPEFGRGFGEAHTDTMSAREALLASHFTATGERDAAGGSLALWGRASQSRFEGREGALSLDGEVTTAMLGADYARGDWLVGLALTQSEGEGGHGGADAGEVEASLTAAVPYAALHASERLTLWGAAGFGSGEMTLRERATTYRPDIDWTMAAAGLRGELMAPPAEGSGPALALASDAFWARTRSDAVSGANGNLGASDSDVTRLRLGLEGSWRVALDGGGHLTPKLEVGVRHDGGDAETGLGVELGGGLAWSAPALGLELDVTARTLIAHGDDDFEERGLAASLVFDPDPATERGASLTLRQALGPGGGLDALFAPAPWTGRGAGEAAPRWAAEAAYGFPAFGGRFTGSPHVGLGLATGTRDYSLGWRLTPAANANAPDLSLGLKATRRESDTAEPEHTVGFQVTARW